MKNENKRMIVQFKYLNEGQLYPSTKGSSGKGKFFFTLEKKIFLANRNSIILYRC
jgi:hypothetical protein